MHSPPFAPLVTVSGVSHRFGAGASVLTDLHLTVAPGEIVVLTGPSGSGKTTLLTLIGALRSLQTGSIRLGATELAGLSAAGQVAVRRGLGFIFQEHNLFESLTARQNIAMATCLAPDRAVPAAEDPFVQLGLAGLDHRKPRELSSGQRQRVAIARALSTRPPLVLADEPTAALDRETGATVLTLIRRLADTARTAALVVTHDSRIFPFADRLVNLVDGRLVADLPLKTLVALCHHLRRSGEFPALSPGALVQVARAMSVVTVAAGALLATPGVILAGEARAETGGATLGPGAVFGAAALLADRPVPPVRALTAVRAATLTREAFLAACARERSLDEQILTQLFHTLI